jgi:hypothetical protein
MVWFGLGGRGLWAAPPPAGKPVRAQAAASQRFSLMDKLYMRQVPYRICRGMSHLRAEKNVKFSFGTFTVEETCIFLIRK